MPYSAYAERTLRPVGPEVSGGARADGEGEEMKHPPPPGEKLVLTRDEFQALRDVKVGKRITPEMQARLTKLKLAEQKLGGFSLTNDGELRLAHGR